MTYGFERLGAEEWDAIARHPVDWRWDEAWEAALANGAAPVGPAVEAARRAGANSKAAALASAAVLGYRVRHRLTSEQLEALWEPVEGLIELPASGERADVKPSRRRLFSWRRCPLAAAVGLAA